MNKKKQKSFLLWLVWLLEGVVVGFGAILPGISGGTLMVAFGMYRPLIETISTLGRALKKYGMMLLVFVLGVAVGFVGLSGVASWMLEKNTVLVTCAFIGFILGTFPELWRDAGQEGRTKRSYFFLVLCFVVMLITLALLRSRVSLTIQADTAGFALCGVLWGLSFIVPGLSSSSLLLFFGLYQPMLAGISTLDFTVLIPMALGMGICALLLSRLVGLAYKLHYSAMSHGVLGIVAATAVMIYPFQTVSPGELALQLLMVVLGTALSLFFGKMCDKLRAEADGES